MTRGPDGRWTALDARHLYAQAKTAGYLYQSQLRAELVRRLGVEWTPVRNGTADIAGIPSSVLRNFSRRRAEIDRAMADRGDRSSKAAQVATLDTRQAKDYRVSPESLADGWRERARRLGFDRDELTAVTDRSGAREPERPEVERTANELTSPKGLTRGRSTFTRRDVLQAWCERLPHGADVGAVEQLADAFLDSDRTVPLARDVRGLTHRDVIRRADGRVIAATAEERRHSTPELLALEKQLIDGALARRDEHVSVVRKKTVDDSLRRRPTLGRDQAEMVRRLTRDGDGVQVVTGKAGAGKTFALDAAREAWEAEGHRVIGAAVARRAARELEDGAGIESTSLAALLQDLRAGGDHSLAQRSVVVVDEASMAGTRQLAELLDHAQAAQAKVVLVGDDRQLPEIDAGGAFRALMTRTEPIELTENRRQSEAWEREALDHLREGRPEEAIERYQRHGRVVLGEGAEDVRARLVGDWWQAAGEGEAAMVAARRDDVADLNGRARALMRAGGHLGPDALRVGARDFAVGDHVVTLKNARRLGVVNGTRATVTEVDDESGELGLRTTDGRDLRLPASYLEALTEHGGPTLDHSYAITGHKAQGMTTGKAFVLGTDDLYREWGYVAMSRGSEENRLYVVAPRARERDEYAPPEESRDPLDAVVAALKYSHAQTAALDVAAREGIAGTTTSDLLAERTRLAERLGAGGSDAAQLERTAGQRAEAERQADQAGDRANRAEREGSGRARGRGSDPAAADRAIEAQARERARQLAAREATLKGRPSSAPAGATPDPEQVARYAAIGDELDRRRRSMARAAAVAKPDYLVTELGSYPERPSERRAWRRAATQVELYRQQFDISDPKSALGTEPREMPQRSAWREARREVERAQRELAGPAQRQQRRGRELE